MSAEFRVSMLIQANAAQAKAEVAAMRGEVEKLAAGAAAAGDTTAAAAPDLGALGAAADATAADIIRTLQAEGLWAAHVAATRAAIHPMVGEYHQLGAAMRQLATFEEMGALNANEAAQAHDVLSRKVTDLIGRMEAANVSLDATTAAMSRQTTTAQDLINRMTGVSNATGETIADTLRHGAALDDLRARYNPLFAASRNYELELRAIAEAERLGAINALEAASARERASTMLSPAKMAAPSQPNPANEQEWAAHVQATRAIAQPLVGEYLELAAAIQQVNQFESLGALSANEAAQAHDVLSRKVTDLIGRMEAANVSLDANAAAMGRQTTTTQDLINRMTGVSTATGETIADTLRHGAALDDLRARYNPLFAASREYELELRNIAEAERLGAISAQEAAAARDRTAQALAPIPGQLGRIGVSSQQAASYMGNLGYQLNDITMMMSLGQSPFMLMMQQGPQVSQILNDMRNKGMALGPTLAKAFTGLISPVSLATMAIIGFGSVAVGWLTSGKEEALNFEDGLRQLEDRSKAYAETTRKMGASQEDLRKEFGLTSEAARKLLADISEIELRQAMRAADASVGSIGRELNLDLTPGPKFANGPELKLNRLFDFNLLEIEAQKALTTVVAGFREVDAAITLDDKIAATRALAESFALAAQASGDVSKAEDDVLQKIYEQLGAYQRLQATRQEAARAEFTRDYVKPAAEAVSGFIDRGAEAAEALQLLATLESEANIRQLINQYGRDSAQVAAARLEAEQAAFQEMVAGLDVTQTVKDELNAAWAAANGLASAQIAAMIERALGPASALSSLLQSAAGWWTQVRANAELAQMAKPAPLSEQLAQYGAGRAAGEAMLREEAALYGGDGNPLTKGVAGVPKVSKGGVGVGGSGGGAKEERNALQDLIDEQERQIATLRILDPVQLEIAKNHEALSKATKEEKANVADLIAERMRLQEVRDRLEEIGQTGKDIFIGLVRGTMSFGDAISNVLGKLAEMAASSAWDMIWGGKPGGGGGFGGWLGGLMGLGGGGGGGGTGSLGLPMPFAEGGKVTGPGGPRDDKIASWLSNGEFVVNAGATAEHQPLLEAINAGLPIGPLLDIIAGRTSAHEEQMQSSWMPAFATGGLVSAQGATAPAALRSMGGSGVNSASSLGGGAGQASSQAAMSGPPVFHIHLNGAAGNSEIIEMVRSGVTAGLRAYDQDVLPGRVAKISQNPRVR